MTWTQSYISHTLDDDRRNLLLVEEPKRQYGVYLLKLSEAIGRMIT